MFTKLYLGMAYLNPTLGALTVDTTISTPVKLGFGAVVLIIGGIIGLSSWSKFADASHKLEQGHQSHTGLIGAILAVVGIVIIAAVMSKAGTGGQLMQDIINK